MFTSSFKKQFLFVRWDILETGFSLHEKWICLIHVNQRIVNRKVIKRFSLIMAFINRKHTLKNYTLKTIKANVQPLAAAVKKCFDYLINRVVQWYISKTRIVSFKLLSLIWYTHFKISMNLSIPYVCIKDNRSCFLFAASRSNYLMQVNCCEPKCIFTFITSDFLDVFQYLESQKSLVWKGPPKIIQLNFLLRSWP